MAGAKRQAPFAYHGLDRLFHEKARLGIVSVLAGSPDGMVFPDLKTLCGLTDGNLNRHLQVLEEAGYVVFEKEYRGKRAYTRCRLTARGRARFSDYLEVLEQALRRARTAAAGAIAPVQGLLKQPS